MRVFVTGGAGFIGSQVARVLIEGGHQVTVFDNLSTGRHDLVPESAAFVLGDLAQDEALRTAITGHDIVIHLAALVPVATSVIRPVDYAENNVVNTVRLLEAMRSSGVRRIVFSSSATVYGVPRRLPLQEDDPVGVQSNPYGASKVSCESFIAAYSQLHGFDATILRYFNPYGPNELCEPETHIVPNIIKSALTNKPIPIFWGGEQIRDFIYVEDLARAHAAVLESTGLNYFNVGSEKGTEIKDLLQMISDILGRPLPIDDKGDRPGDVHASYATSERLRKATGWQIQVEMAEGLKRTVAFYERHLASGGGSAG